MTELPIEQGEVLSIQVSEGDVVMADQILLVSCHTCNKGMIAADFLLSKAGNRRAYRKDTYPVFQRRSAKNLRNPSGAREFCRSAALSQNDDAFASPYLFRLAETTKFFSSYLHYRCDMTLELETGKATVEVPAPAGGKIVKALVTEGSLVKIGDPVFHLDGRPEKNEVPEPTSSPLETKKENGLENKSPPKKRGESKPLPQPPQTTAKKPVRAAPSVRRFAREIGVDITSIKGTGPRERVLLKDVKNYSKKLHEQTSVRTGVLSYPALPDFSTFGPTRREKMSVIRKTTMQHMSTCWSNIPHVTNFAEADVTDLEKLRKSCMDRAKESDIKLTVTSMVIKVLALALKKFPVFNASLDVEKEEVIFKDYVHIGVAVDTPRGLLVPVLRDADQKNIFQIASTLTELAHKAQTGKIVPGDLQGGCITLTNLGGLGGAHFTPIINFPEVAIFGIGRSQTRPVYMESTMEARLMMPLSLSYDHRLIDGADGTRFLQWMVKALEGPLFSMFDDFGN